MCVKRVWCVCICSDLLFASNKRQFHGSFTYARYLFHEVVQCCEFVCNDGVCSQILIPYMICSVWHAEKHRSFSRRDKFMRNLLQ